MVVSVPQHILCPSITETSDDSSLFLKLSQESVFDTDCKGRRSLLPKAAAVAGFPESRDVSEEFTCPWWPYF